jgi:hypothetical protein
VQTTFKNKIMNYHFFWDGPFSNWYPATFKYADSVFENSEQAFMWRKAIFFNDLETAKKILITPNPRAVKALGREVRNFNTVEWMKVCYQYMLEINIEKFGQNKDLMMELMKHENYVEASPYDTIWGIGMGEKYPGVEDPKNWKGLNYLGEVLNEVKKYFANKS